MKTTFITIIFLSLIYTLKPQESPWNFSGQIQLRSEIDARDFSNQTRALSYATLRTRLSVSKNLFENFNFFVQIQDSRIFGNTPNTLTAINNLDLHQANLTLKEPLGLPLNVKAGRFELSYGTQRFIGPVGWHYVGRSFDGAVLNLNPGVNIDVFALTLNDNQKYIPNSIPSIYHDSLPPANNSSMYGFWAKKELSKSQIIDFFTFYEINRIKDTKDNPALSLGTAGVNYNGIFGNFSTLFEGAYQIGSIYQTDVSAYLLSLILNYKINSFNLATGADILSGTDTSKTQKYNSFTTNYATNHKFYGFMDYFINIPNNTNKLGLRDFYAMAKWLPESSDFNFAADFHIFMSDKKTSDNQNNFGNELDITVNYKFNKNATITWGGSTFIPGEIMKTMFSTQKYKKEDIGFWTYIMIQANL